MPRVAVIGGGIIGLLSAYHLRKRGADVIVIDKGKAGQACSVGNAGWLVPSIAGPLPSPGLTLKSIKWLLRPDSPLYIKPAAIPSLLGWLWRFNRHCNLKDYEAGFHAVAAFGRTTMSLYDELAADGVAFEMEQRAMLFLFHTETEMRPVLDDLRRLEQYGYTRPTELSGRELQQIEPALATDLQCGLRLEGDRYVEPETLCAGLAASLRDAGVEIREDLAAREVIRNGERVTALVCSDGRVQADTFVIAAGAWSGRLAGQCGYHLPVQAGKGYSITVTNPAVEVHHPLYLEDAKIGCTPFRGAFRIAGMMELSGVNLTLDRRRVLALERAVQRYVPNALAGESREEWVGMRPITPDGLPMIGRLPSCSNVYVATGHAMLGVTLAASTGAALAELILEGRSETDLRPFDPGRF